MPEQQIIITIDENGKITAKTNGFKGDACIDAVAELMDETINISSLKKTDEYYQQATSKLPQSINMKKT